MVVILLLAFILLALLFSNKDTRYIEASLKATSVWCGLLLFHIEVFSVFKCLNNVSVFLYWLVVCFITAGCLFKKKRSLKINDLLNSIKILIVKNKFLTIALSLVVIMSVLTVPYNWDSMTYHIARIAHWVQNQSVGHYATHSVRQVANPAFHEFVCLDLYILSGNRDIFLNLVQGVSFLANAWLVYEIAKKMNCKDKFCKIGLLLFISMPIAFGEALTTQNDNLGGVFFLGFVYYLLDFLHLDRKIEDKKATYVNCSCMAVFVGCGYLTKPTVSMGMLFLAVVLLGICIIRRDSFKTIMKLIGTVVPILFLLIVPEMIRNIVTFGAIFPSGTGARQLVGTLNPKYLFVNGLKNISFNLPTIYILNSNRIIVSVIYKISDFIGVDINDPSISEDGRVFSLGDAGDFGHDTAVSSTILIVSIICLIWCIYRRKKTDGYKKFYTYIVMALFVAFCVFVRWEPFVSRYMLPYLALMCPMAAIWLEDMSQNAKSELVRGSCVPVVGWLCVAGLIMLGSYHGRILKQQMLSRPEGYFTNRGGISAEYIDACETVNSIEAQNVGFIFKGSTYEYPVQYMLKHDVERIEHIMVENETQKYEDTAYKPDCILTQDDLGEMIEVRGLNYEKVMGGENINVYQKME